MFTRIRKLLAAPIFIDDEHKTHVASLLTASVWIILAATLGFAVIFPIFQPDLAWRLILLLPLLFLLLTIFIYIRRGQVQLGSSLLIIGTWVVLIYTAAFNGGVFAPAYSGCIVIVLLAGLLSGRRAALLTAGASILAGLPLLYAEATGLLPSRFQFATPISTWLSQASFFVIAAVLLHLATTSISAALAREQRLNEVARAINSSSDLSTLLEKIVRLAANLVNADMGWLGLLNPEGEAILSAFDFNLPSKLRLPPLPKGQGLSWQIIETQQAALVTDYPRHPKALASWIEAGALAYLGVPLVVGETCLGVLGLVSATPGKTFTRRDQALIESIGRQAGVAIQNARLYKQTHQRAEQLSILNQIGQAVSTLRELPSVLEVIYQQLGSG